MSTPEARIGSLERDHARLDQRVSDLTNQVTSLLPLASGSVRLEAAAGGLKDDISRLELRIDAINKRIAERDQASTDERRSLRLALFGLTGTIVAAMIAAVATLIAGGIHP